VPYPAAARPAADPLVAAGRGSHSRSVVVERGPRALTLAARLGLAEASCLRQRVLRPV
jgi:hypothetical protein